MAFSTVSGERTFKVFREFTHTPVGSGHSNATESKFDVQVFPDKSWPYNTVIVSAFQQAIILENLGPYKPEPEDDILADPDLLPRLLAQAKQQSSSTDWRQKLDDL
jgi:hypothetical protein